MTAVLNFPQEDHSMSQPSSNRAPVETGELWRWVDRLTRDRTQRLVRQLPGMKPVVEYVPVPCMWTQLVEAVASDNTGGGRGKSSTGSRSPLDLEVEALMIEISDKVITALRTLGHTARIQYLAPRNRPGIPAPRLVNDLGHQLFDPDTAGRLTERSARTLADAHDRRNAARLRHDTKSDLRQLASVVAGTRNPVLTTGWTDRYRLWVLRAETTLTADDESVDMRSIRGHACPVCLALWVTSERDGEQFRDAALVIAFRDGHVQHITCRACSAGWWRGDDVEQLRQQLAQNEAVYGPASIWGETVPKATS